MAREINLVPDIKDQMIKTLKLRNFIFFLCIVVASASVGVTFIFGAIVGGQQIAIDSKTATLSSLSEKLNSYRDLNDFLTIKDQLGNISSITENKTLTSRTFNVLSALIPTGIDTITISELNINFANEAPTFTFDAQANSGETPSIDYKVLDSFKKSMQYMRYDYGNYVDKEGSQIPAYCMIEKDSSGAYFTDSSKGLYAYWTILAEGCNDLERKDLNSLKYDESGNVQFSDEKTTIAGYELENYNGTAVVKIWRTPQFEDWYKKSYIETNGVISGIPHFESSCITYGGERQSTSSKIKWTESNDSCLLVPDGVDGIQILESTNGRNAAEELVLRFSAILTLTPEVYNFNNPHLIALGPSERRNVTDSYVQIQAMFGERARDCQENDLECKGGN